MASPFTKLPSSHSHAFCIRSDFVLVGQSDLGLHAHSRVAVALSLDPSLYSRTTLTRVTPAQHE